MLNGAILENSFNDIKEPDEDTSAETQAEQVKEEIQEDVSAKEEMAIEESTQSEESNPFGIHYEYLEILKVVSFKEEATSEEYFESDEEDSDNDILEIGNTEITIPLPSILDVEIPNENVPEPRRNPKRKAQMHKLPYDVAIKMGLKGHFEGTSFGTLKPKPVPKKNYIRSDDSCSSDVGICAADISNPAGSLQTEDKESVASPSGYSISVPSGVSTEVVHITCHLDISVIKLANGDEDEDCQIKIGY